MLGMLGQSHLNIKQAKDALSNPSYKSWETYQYQITAFRGSELRLIHRTIIHDAIALRQ